MRLITTADDEFYQAVCLAGKLGRLTPLVDTLAERHEAEWDSPDVSFRYALALMATLRTVTSDVDGHRRYNAAMDALGDVLAAAADHWPARYCRARLRALVPTGFGVYPIFTEHERTMATGDLTELADRQSRVPWQPYFASTHLLWGYVAGQRQDWAEARRLILAAAEHPLAPVGLPALGAVLCEPFLALYGQVEADERAIVGTMMATLFADVPAVAAALAQPVR